ncbi:MAG: hypothetical protein IJI59_04755 [Clostridia bacterium]|nr:hypothetical protein [Clostridia bacterium]
MRIALIVMADVLVLVVAVLVVNEYQCLKRRNSFTVPFTDRLIACGAVDPARREHILKSDAVIHGVGIALCVGVWVMLTAFFAGISGALAFPVAVGALLLKLKPEMGETDETRKQYYNAHRDDINDIKYHEYLKAAGAAGEGDRV